MIFLRNRRLAMRWEDVIPGDWTANDGRVWRDMSWAERQVEMSKTPSLRKLLPKSWRDARAKAFRLHRELESRGEVLVRCL
jgi:hypothetical protein